MTDLSSAIADYLKVRRVLGHKMELAERLLGQFCIYYEQDGATHITTDLAVAWATLPVDASAGWWAQRLGVVRGFAAWLQTLGEVIRLDRGDVCADAGLVRVINTKFGKSREVPLHPSSVEALVGYEQQRDRLCPVPVDNSFFVSTPGTRLRYSVIQPTFKKLAGQAGLQPRSPRCRPRIHDVRHSVAVRALVDCYATGGDALTLLPLLSTFMGHTDPKSTYWYLSAAPELMALTSRRLEDAFEVNR